MLNLELLRQAMDSWQPPEVPENIPQGDMPGDKVWIGPVSQKKAKAAFRALLPKLAEALERNESHKAVISVSGGSGVGKTCVSALLAYYLNQLGVGAYTLSGDNYPRRYPELNDQERTRIFRLAGVRGMLQAGSYSPERAAVLRGLQEAGEDPVPALCEKEPWLRDYQAAGREALSQYLGTELEQEYEQLEGVLARFKKGEKEIWLKRMGRDDTALWYDRKDFSEISVLVLEWTHGNSGRFEGVDVPILLGSTPAENRAYRLSRGRDANADTPFITMVLELEQAKLEARAEYAGIILSNAGEVVSLERYRADMDAGR